MKLHPLVGDDVVYGKEMNLDENAIVLWGIWISLFPPHCLPLLQGSDSEPTLTAGPVFSINIKAKSPWLPEFGFSYGHWLPLNAMSH